MSMSQYLDNLSLRPKPPLLYPLRYSHFHVPYIVSPALKSSLRCDTRFPGTAPRRARGRPRRFPALPRNTRWRSKIRRRGRGSPPIPCTSSATLRPRSGIRSTLRCGAVRCLVLAAAGAGKVPRVNGDAWSDLLPVIARHLLGDPPAIEAGGSLAAHVDGPQRGTFRDFEAGVSGGVLDLVTHLVEHVNGRTASAAWLKVEGLAPDGPPSPAERRTPARPADGRPGSPWP